MIKIEVLVATPDGAPIDRSFLDSVAGEAGVRVTLHDPSLLSGLAHGEATDAAPPFGCLVELTCDSPSSASTRIDWLRDRLVRAEVDRAACTVVAGTEFVVVPGEEQIMLAMALTRRQGMTQDEFVEYWRTTHAELGRTVPGSEGYRQVHPDPALTEQAAHELGFGGPRFDGVAIAYYSSPAAFEAIMANAEVTSTLLADERRFIDHSRAAMIVGREPLSTSRA